MGFVSFQCMQTEVDGFYFFSTHANQGKWILFLFNFQLMQQADKFCFFSMHTKRGQWVLFLFNSCKRQMGYTQIAKGGWVTRKSKKWMQVLLITCYKIERLREKEGQRGKSELFFISLTMCKYKVERPIYRQNNPTREEP